MVSLTGSADVRQPLDWALIALAILILVIAAAVGGYGFSVAYVTTLSWEHEYEWVSLVCGLITAGCAAYLLLEYTGPRNQRAVIAAIITAAVLGWFAPSNGVPAILTALDGKPGVEVFEVEHIGSGGRSCPTRVTARHPEYSELRVCITAFKGRRPGVGERFEVEGRVSPWGMTRERYRVL